MLFRSLRRNPITNNILFTRSLSTLANMKGYVRACKLQDTYSHTRFHLSLRTRSVPAVYHRLLLFRINKPDSPKVSCDAVESNGADSAEVAAASGTEPELYCMEEACPHLGAPLSHAELEVDDIEDTRAVVCPWHQYDFDLKTGSSSTGLQTCTYDVKIARDAEEPEVWVEAPHVEGKHEWEVIEFRGVSEEFADPPPLSLGGLSLGDGAGSTGALNAENTIAAVKLPEDLPNSLLGFAHLVLATADPTMKCALTREAVSRMRAGKLRSIRPNPSEMRKAKENGDLVDVPPRLQEAVTPGKVGKRGKGGSEKSRIMMLHALANIEQYAIDLAWDIIARFADFEVNGERLPIEFFLDWAKVAEDEAKHYSLLSKRLVEMGSYFGAHNVHAGLWDSAMDTAHSLLSRIAIIHLVAEARGVDMNPLTMAKLRSAGDEESTRILEIIHADEITHVTTGHRWFSWICAKQGIDPVQQFRQEVAENFHGDLRGPFNVEDRAKAGLTPDFYTDLKGHHRRKQEVYAGGTGNGGGDAHMHPRLT